MKITNQLMQLLTSKVEIERIYQFSYHFLDQEHHRLLIVLDSKCSVSPATLEPTIDMCLGETKGLTYMVLPSGEVKTAIKNGNLFYTIICQEKNLCYHDGKKSIPSSTKEELEIVKVKSDGLFYSSQKKATDFMEGMQFYTSKGNLHQAAFMLHQATEQSLRGILHAVFKKDKPSHSLQEHLKIIGRFVPAIATLFPKDNIYEFGLLQLLDKAYTTVRYKNDFMIEEEELAILTSKIDLVLIWSNTFFNECSSSLEELNVMEQQLKNTVKPILTKAVSTETNFKDVKVSIQTNILNASHKKKLNTLMDKVCEQHSVSQIKVLGVKTAAYQTNSIYKLEQLEEQSAHCYLLVILKGSQEVRSYTSNQGDLKITMLIHHEKEIGYALEKRNRFFIQSMETGIEFYKSEAHPIQFNIPEPDWQHSLTSANHLFENRLGRLANMFLESAKHVYQHIDDSAHEACLLLLTHCIEQVCISYIYINTGYRVNNHHLPFLLDLCGMIGPDISRILHQNTTVEKRQMEALMNCVQYIRNKNKCTLEHEDLSMLLKRCKNLVEVIEKICKTELDRLRNLAYPEEDKKLTA